MKLSTKGQYAILALLDIEKQTRNLYGTGVNGKTSAKTLSKSNAILSADINQNEATEIVKLDDISKRQDISVSYLEQIFMKLRRAGLVKSIRGPGGGYMLAKNAADITVKEIMDAVREDFQTTRCKDNRIYGCMGDKKCVGHDFWKWFSNSMEILLDRVSLADIIDKKFPNVNGYGFFFKDNCSKDIDCNNCTTDFLFEK